MIDAGVAASSIATADVARWTGPMASSTFSGSDFLFV
jgi:hypothetical protein